MSKEIQPHRKNLLEVLVNQQVSVVQIQEITMPAGQAAPRHLHPCSVLGIVKSGAVRFQEEGQEERIIGPGEAFYEPRNRPILHFDNASAQEPLVFVAFYLKEADEPNIRILNDEPAH